MSETLPRFGANDFYYLETDAAALRERLREVCSDYLGYSVTDSDPYFVTCLSLLPFFVQLSAAADVAAKSTLLQYAKGQDLDRIAQAVCVAGYLDRLPPRRGKILCLWGAETVASSDPWSVDAEFEGVRFVGSGDSLPGPGYAFYLYTAEETGAANGFSDLWAFGAFADALNAGLTTNGTGVISLSAADSLVWGGFSAEDDAHFAERIRERQAALRIPGGVDYYKTMLKEIPGVYDATVSPVVNDDGEVCVYFTGEATLSAVSAIVAQKKVLGQAVYVAYGYPRETRGQSLRPRPVTVTIKYALFSGSPLTAAGVVVRKICEFIASVSYRFGSLPLDGLMRDVVEAGAAYCDCFSGTERVASFNLSLDEYVTAANFVVQRDDDVTVSENAPTDKGASIVV